MWKSECQYLIRRRLDDSDKQFVAEYGETGSESKLKISSSMYVTSTRYFIRNTSEFQLLLVEDFII